MTYLSNLGAAMNRTARTENGAVTLRTSQNPLVDFFALAGATRKNPHLGLDLFKKAFAFDPQSAVRILFYLRDVRGGQGERALFRTCLVYLADQEKAVCDKIAPHVSEFGRWDDLFVLEVETILPLIKTQLGTDIASETPSLLAKWLPSENTSSTRTRTLARGMYRALGYTARDYRKMLSMLRKQIVLVEQKMSQKLWGEIEYGKIPSQASLKYRKAFGRHDQTRYAAYLQSVAKGEATINTATLYPHQVYKIAGTQGAEELWANLPDYTEGKNAIVVADVSGSMSGEPLSVSVSLALYFAERNQGPFKDHFITFSGNPTLQKIQGTTLRDKVNSIERAHWEMNTNVEKVFRLLVDTAVKTGASADEMPQTIYIISDMEFDAATLQGKTNFEAIDEMYAEAGFKRPNLVFWNVDARNKQVPVQQNEQGVTLVSGFSPSTFKLAIENKSPIDLVMDIVNSPRYSVINL